MNQTPLAGGRFSADVFPCSALTKSAQAAVMKCIKYILSEIIPPGQSFFFPPLRPVAAGLSVLTDKVNTKGDNMMAKMGEFYQSADWKTEKHVPVIECAEQVAAGEMFEVKVSIGKEVSHPNKTEHHIRWIKLYFLPDGGKFPYQIGQFEFSAHGESVEGPDTGPVYTNHSVIATMKTTKPGLLLVTSYCNIHGLWENSQEIKLG
jgi:superoxide reductase